jgi:hypothetical protein
MAHYIYEIKRNGNVEHTSFLFLTLKAAYDYFMEQDAPNHYGKIKFKRSHSVTASLVNRETTPSIMNDIIRVQFKKVESNPVPYGEWSDLCDQEGLNAK